MMESSVNILNLEGVSLFPLTTVIPVKNQFKYPINLLPAVMRVNSNEPYEYQTHPIRLPPHQHSPVRVVLGSGNDLALSHNRVSPPAVLVFLMDS